MAKSFIIDGLKEGFWIFLGEKAWKRLGCPAKGSSTLSNTCSGWGQAFGNL